MNIVSKSGLLIILVTPLCWLTPKCWSTPGGNIPCLPQLHQQPLSWIHFPIYMCNCQKRWFQPTKHLFAGRNTQQGTTCILSIIFSVHLTIERWWNSLQHQPLQDQVIFSETIMFRLSTNLLVFGSVLKFSIVLFDSFFNLALVRARHRSVVRVTLCTICTIW